MKYKYSGLTYRGKEPTFYRRWASMLNRCKNKGNKDFHHYGGRGIYVVEEWLNYINFHKWCEATFENGKSLDRIDNNGPYAPWNCRWATQSEQIRNSSQSLCKKIKIKSISNREKIFGNPKTRTDKICTSCRSKLPLIEFNNDSRRADGKEYKCRNCSREAYRNRCKRRGLRDDRNQ